jgi:hypothetical protein
MLAVNKNLNRQLEAESEMLSNLENRRAQALSKISGMLDSLRWFPARPMYKMSKKTKMSFINKKLNQPL